MQRPDEKKRQLIAATAARMFATRPFHKVKLDDVAAAAGVGKGTLYIYFKSKEELYFWLIHDAFAKLVEQLSAQLGDGALSPTQGLGRIVAELVKFGFDNPQLFELMRSAGPIIKDDRWQHKRKELAALIEQTIRRGNEVGEFNDPHPEITALCVPGLLRSVMLFGPKGLDERTVTNQLVRLLQHGICAEENMRKTTRNGTAAATAATGASGRGGR
jgi:AcrR family transcriptional regulator